jgi:hypothetical protein
VFIILVISNVWSGKKSNKKAKGGIGKK